MYQHTAKLLPILGFSGRQRIRSSQFLHSRHLLCRSSRLTSTPIVQAPHGSVFSRITGRKVDRMTRSVSQARYRAQHVDQYVLIVHPHRHLERAGNVARLGVVADRGQQRGTVAERLQRRVVLVAQHLYLVLHARALVPAAVPQDGGGGGRLVQHQRVHITAGAAVVHHQCVDATAGTVHRSTTTTALRTVKSTRRSGWCFCAASRRRGTSSVVANIERRLRPYRLGEDLHLHVRVVLRPCRPAAAIAPPLRREAAALVVIRALLSLRCILLELEPDPWYGGACACWCRIGELPRLIGFLNANVSFKGSLLSSSVLFEVASRRTRLPAERLCPTPP
uniref:Uncharacterized protein n=1 Tax=Anopheles coluzzii TaxID=1518534 RepID=A0A8W7Q102_ANOCL